MAPKTKIKKEEIVSAAFEITKAEGIEAVTAKAVAKKLNCSIQPVYWVFETMDNLRRAVTEEAVKEFNRYSLSEIPGVNRYHSYGLNYIRFAKEQPQLFRLLYMTDRQESLNIAETNIDENKGYLVSLIKELYGLSDIDANKLYVDMWVVSHGIATLLVTKTANLSGDDIAAMLKDIAAGLVKNFKSK